MDDVTQTSISISLPWSDWEYTLANLGRHVGGRISIPARELAAIKSLYDQINQALLEVRS